MVGTFGKHKKGRVGTAAWDTHPPPAPAGGVGTTPGWPWQSPLKAAAWRSLVWSGSVTEALCLGSVPTVWHTAGQRAGTAGCDAGAAKSLLKNG